MASTGFVIHLWQEYHTTALLGCETDSYSKQYDEIYANHVHVFPKLIQQRAAEVELEDYHSQINELSQSKKQLQTELAKLKDQLEIELMGKNEESSVASPPDWLLNSSAVARCQLQAQLQELEITSTTLSTIHSGTLLALVNSFVSHPNI